MVTMGREMEENINGEKKSQILLNGFKIGNVKINSNVVAAPMAGVTDLPFRLLCHELGAGLVYTEMVSAKAIHYNNRKTEDLMVTDQQEKPVSLQLFGSEPGLMAEIAKRVEDRPFDMIDINMGCPMPKIVNNGDGSALMKDPALIGRIIESVVGAVKKPVTVKIRKGFDEAHINAVEIAHIAEESGASAITVHGRTREQYYSGKADWEIIKKVCDTVKIPVIGNGDVTSPELAKKMIDETGCSAVMIGRAAQGNPWIFRETASYLQEGKKLPRPTHKEMRETIMRHAQMQVECKGEYNAVREMRKHIAWYTTGMPGSAQLRGRINEMEHMEDLERAINLIFREGVPLK